MAQNIFAYGTLMFPEILFPLTSRRFDMPDATLKGYERCGVYGLDNSIKSYPAIRFRIGGEVSGKLIHGVDAESLDIMDFFEGDEYERKEVTVCSSGKELSAYAYVWCMDESRLIPGRWDVPEFRRRYLDTYLRLKIPQVVAEYKNQKESKKI